MAIKVSLVSLGCEKNLVDSERMLWKLREHGYQLVVEPGEAQVVIVNTCGFIQSAKEEAIETILELSKLKEDGTLKKIILTGCLSQRYQEEVAQEFPELDAVIGIGNEKDIVAILDQVLEGERPILFNHINELELTGKRLLTTLPFFTYLKIADGCSNGCTYCAIPAIRGKYRSVPMEDVLAEARYFAENGVTELIVIAQDTTRYGEDLYGVSKLPELLTELCKLDGLRWIRVMYLYPERITDELLDVIAREEKIVKYLDIPMQHCNAEILKKMRRGGDEASLTALVEKIRNKIPDVVLRTTFMTGFPGETDEQFTELAEFALKHRFERMGCFAYSQEEGTVAAKMEQLDEEIRKHRCDVLYEQQLEISAEFNQSKIGQTLEVVIEGYDQWAEIWFGRSKMDAPDVDGMIYVHSERKLNIGEYVSVEIAETMDYDLIGYIVE